MYRLIVLLVFSALLASASAFAEKSLQLHAVDLTRIRFTEKGPWYTVAMIHPDHAPGAPGGAARRFELAQKLAQAAQDFRIRVYRERYPEWPESYFEDMKLKDPPLDNRTTLILVFEGDDPRKMKAMLWQSYMTPFEQDLRMEIYPMEGWRYPRPALEPVTEYPFHDFSTAKAETIVHKFPGALKGDVIELKAYIQDLASAEDFVPLLYYFGELDWGYYRRWRQIDVPEALHPALKRATTVLLPGEYALVCDPKLVPLYRRLGFTLVPEASSGPDVVMRLSREAYIGIGAKLKARKGYSLFETYARLTLAEKCSDSLKSHVEEEAGLLGAIEKNLNRVRTPRRAR